MPRKSAAALRMSRPPKGGPEAYNPAEDPAPDVYSVVWSADRVHVLHWRSRVAPVPCCEVDGAITAEDRAAAFAEEVPPEVVCLRRLKMPCGIDSQAPTGSQP